MSQTWPSSVAVVGAGAWGTALACHLAQVGHRVSLWAYEAPVAEAINQAHQNPTFLPDLELPANLDASSNLSRVLGGRDLVLVVCPSHVCRTILEQAAPHLDPRAVLVMCNKGIEQGTSYTMHEVAEDVLDKSFHRRLCCLSGPSFAREVASGVPTAVTVASRNQRQAEQVQQAASTPRFRVYTSPDVVGVELGGAVKNPLAIAAGMIKGMKLGDDTLAAMVTRGLAEMTRLSIARGGQMATLYGLAGLGDLVLTCYGDLSRNRAVGLALARGQTIDEITSATSTVAEGILNTKNILDMANNAGVEMPIVSAVYGVIYQGQRVWDALEYLMTRDLKPELSGMALPSSN